MALFQPSLFHESLSQVNFFFNLSLADEYRSIELPHKSFSLEKSNFVGRKTTEYRTSVTFFESREKSGEKNTVEEKHAYKDWLNERQG